MPNLYVIEQSINDDYDTYDSAVVVSETPELAKLIHPNGRSTGEWWNNERLMLRDDWTTPDRVNAKFIDVADPQLEVGTVIVSSFNAG